MIKKTLNICKNSVKKEIFNNYQYLDLGCGKGKSIIYYLENFGGKAKYQPVGIEYDKNLITTSTNFV